jgi:hypothetical protein
MLLIDLITVTLSVGLLFTGFYYFLEWIFGSENEY